MPCRNWIHLMIMTPTTGWKVSVFGVILVRIFPHSDWIQFEYGKIWMRITPNTNTFYAVNLYVRTNQCHCKSHVICIKFFNFSKNRQFHSKWFTNECTRFNCENSLDLNTLSFWKFKENKSLQVLEPHFSSRLTC